MSKKNSTPQKSLFWKILTSAIVFLGVAACNNSTSFSPGRDGNDVSKASDRGCVQVFYDKSTDATHKTGRTHALMLLNLMGHFPEYQQIVGPIESYKKGDVDKCHATFYIGSFYNNPIPDAFIQDYKTTTKQVVWIGYNFWKLGYEFERTFGYRDYSFTTLDQTNKSSDGKPGYFRDVLYKGETFYKFSTWSPAPPSSSDTTPPTLLTAFEVAKLSNKTSNASQVLAEVKHSTSGEVIPWVLQSQNKFFVAEIPFSFIHEADRYFVFADLMFDFLKEQPRHNSRNAILRLEDIHPLVDLSWLDKAYNIVKSRGLIPHVMIVPVFRDPFMEYDRTDKRVEIPMQDVPSFYTLMQRYKQEGSVFIWHGVTHQYNDIKNPFTGASGDDYEFWDSTKNTPVAEDSVPWVLDRLEKGFNSLKLFNIVPKVWVTPHYHGSPLDNVMFGQIFSWVIGRGVYFDHSTTGLKSVTAAKPLGYDTNDAATRLQNRREQFADLKVTTVPGTTQFGQLYPYEIYGNIYGENIIPENLGNVQPTLNNQVVATRNVARILEDAKRNLVLRDVWASVFYHPFLLDPKNNPENADPTKPTDLERLIDGLTALGYNFINVDDYATNTNVRKSKPRIEIE